MAFNQPCILADLSPHSRYLTFRINASAAVQPCLLALNDLIDLNNTVIGIGQSLVSVLNADIPLLRSMPAQSKFGIEIPSCPAALWCWVRGIDRGDLYHRAQQIVAVLNPGFSITGSVDTFIHNNSRDLTGYEDGTENPHGNGAVNAAIVQDQGQGLDGSSFVAVQQWVHDFSVFAELSTQEQDNSIGRRKTDNRELDDAPDSAHVKRTAQESFEPNAFILRRSMPWIENEKAGLYFVGFGKSFDAFEALLNRMLGIDDGITDALFQFTRPINGAYFWCPPVNKSKLDLDLLNLRKL